MKNLVKKHRHKMVGVSTNVVDISTYGGSVRESC
jgi:hypothetical protein